MSALLALWSFVASPLGRLVAVGAVALALGFAQGWSLKARLDRSATLQAVIAKQRIDLAAARQKEADDASTIDTLQTAEAFNQERIRDLTSKPGTCIADDAAARGLRRLK
jgi:hypothetical protein